MCSSSCEQAVLTLGIAGQPFALPPLAGLFYSHEPGTCVTLQWYTETQHKSPL